METKISPSLHEALSGEMTPKFVATVDPEGKPNLVLIVSLKPEGDDRMVYGDFLMNKTAKNIEKNQKLGVFVITEDLQWWYMKADHLEFQTAGPIVDKINDGDFFRYNAYMSVRRAGIVGLKEIAAEGKVGKLAMATDFGLTSLSKKSGTPEQNKLSHPVYEKLARLQAVKILSYVGEDGYPVCLPIQSAQPASKSLLAFGALSAPDSILSIPENTFCTVNVLTDDPVSYQVKGPFLGFSKGLFGKTGTIRIEEVWNASPPLAGERIDADTRILK